MNFFGVNATEMQQPVDLDPGDRGRYRVKPKVDNKWC